MDSYIVGYGIVLGFEEDFVIVEDNNTNLTDTTLTSQKIKCLGITNIFYKVGDLVLILHPNHGIDKPLNGENIDTNFIGYDEYFSFCIPITNSSNFELTTGEGGDIASFTNKVNGIELLSEILTTLTEIKATLDTIKTAPRITFSLTSPQGPVSGTITQQDYTIDSNISNLEKNIENITKFINSGD